MAIADKSFEYQDKRSGEWTWVKDTVPRRAWLATAGILVWEDEGPQICIVDMHYAELGRKEWLKTLVTERGKKRDFKATSWFC